MELFIYIHEKLLRAKLRVAWQLLVSKLNESEKKFKPTKFNFTLSGRIVEKATSEPVSCAVISIEGTTIRTNSNIDGYFTILKVPYDTVVLVVSSVEYKFTKFYLNPSVSLTNLNFKIDPEVIALNEIVVTENKYDIDFFSSQEFGLIKVSLKK